PNVMWELGFAMAIAKPTIVLTQNLADLPFDIKDMQTIEYRRTHLSASLAAPLQRGIVDTLSLEANKAQGMASTACNSLEIGGDLLNEIAQLKEMVAGAVRAWTVNDVNPGHGTPELQSLSGHWFNTESQSHVYIRVINGELIGPYCYRGDDNLTGVYW